MTDKRTIGGIPVNAPLWKNTPFDTLNTVVECLKRASHHYADDTGKEWGKADALVCEAAKIINQHKLSVLAIYTLHKEAEPLVQVRKLIDAVLTDARGLAP